MDSKTTIDTSAAAAKLAAVRVALELNRTAIRTTTIALRCEPANSSHWLFLRHARKAVHHECKRLRRYARSLETFIAQCH